MALTESQSQLIGVFFEAVAYGAYFVLFIQSIHVLRKRGRRCCSYLLTTTLSLFFLSTLHLAIDIVRNMLAFTSNESIPNYPTLYYEHFNTWEDIFKNAIYTAITIISDAFVLYRCFIVWGGSYLIVAIPFLLFLADIGIGIFWVYSISLIEIGEDIFTAHNAFSLRLKTFYFITLAMNVVCTTLIAYKIWKIQRDVQQAMNTPPLRVPEGRKNDLSRVVTIIVESASLYSAILIIVIATYMSGSPSMFIFSNGLSPLIGVVFASVIVRVGKGVSQGDKEYESLVVQRPFTRRPAESDFHHRNTFPEGGLQVSLQQTVHIDEFPERDIEGEVEMGDDSDSRKWTETP